MDYPFSPDACAPTRPVEAFFTACDHRADRVCEGDRAAHEGAVKSFLGAVVAAADQRKILLDSAARFYGMKAPAMV